MSVLFGTTIELVDHAYAALVFGLALVHRAVSGGFVEVLDAQVGHGAQLWGEADAGAKAEVRGDARFGVVGGEAAGSGFGSADAVVVAVMFVVAVGRADAGAEGDLLAQLPRVAVRGGDLAAFAVAADVVRHTAVDVTVGGVKVVLQGGIEAAATLVELTQLRVVALAGFVVVRDSRGRAGFPGIRRRCGTA